MPADESAHILEESHITWVSWGAVEHHKAGRIGSRHNDIGPTVTIQVADGHAIDRSLAVAEWDWLILPSRSVLMCTLNAKTTAEVESTPRR